MKIIPIAITIAILLPLNLSAEDFDNWYFAFLKSPANYSGEFFTPDGKRFGSSTGSIHGRLSSDGTEFVESGVYTYQPQNNTVSVTIRWSKDETGRLIGKYSDSEGLKISYTLEITSDKQFKAESKAPDGRTMATIGSLRAGGKVYTEETMRGSDGVIAFTSKNTLSKKNAENSN